MEFSPQQSDHGEFMKDSDSREKVLKEKPWLFFNPYFNNDIIFLVLALKIKHQIIVSIARKRQNHNVRSS